MNCFTRRVLLLGIGVSAFCQVVSNAWAAEPSGLTMQQWVAERGVNVRDYGARGDGRTDDTRAVNAAIRAALGLGGGAVLFPPTPAFYRLTDTINIPVTGRPIWLVGGGQGEASVLRWTTDLGRGHYAVAFDTAAGAVYRGGVEHLSLRGPDPAAPTSAGDPPSQMLGVQLISKCVLRDVAISGFFGGVVMFGDHNGCEHVVLGGNYFGVYCPGGAATHGDHTFFACDLAGCRCASVGVAAKDYLGGATFYSTTLGFSPYGFYKEAGASESFLAGVNLIQSVVENVGNGMIFDASTSGNSFVEGCSFGPTSFDSNYATPGAAHPAIVHAVNVSRCKFDFGDLSGLPQFGPGSEAYLQVRGYQFDHNLIQPGEQLAAAVQASGKPLVSGTMAQGTNHWADADGGWECESHWIGEDVLAGELAEACGHGGNTQRSRGTGRPIAGVYPVAQPTGWGWVQVRGRASVVVSAAVAENAFVTAGATPGQAVASASPGGDVLAGYALTSQTEAGKSCVVQIQPGSGALPGDSVRGGAGSPQGVVTADPGTLYLRSDGGPGTTLYVKESGVGTNTGWVAK